MAIILTGFGVVTQSLARNPTIEVCEREAAIERNGLRECPFRVIQLPVIEIRVRKIVRNEGVIRIEPACRFVVDERLRVSSPACMNVCAIEKRHRSILGISAREPRICRLASPT